MRTLLTTVFVLILAISSGSAQDADSQNKRIVQVIATYQKYDEFMPWQELRPATTYGYGILLDKDTVLTTEAICRNHKLIELMEARAGRKISAEVMLTDPEVNLALLKITGTLQNAPTERLKLHETVPPKNSDLEVVQFDVTKEYERGKAKVLRTSISHLPDAPFAVLTCSLLHDQQVDRKGAGVFMKDRLAGIMIKYNGSSRTGSMIPATVIKQFLKLSETKPYKGFATAGFQWKSLVDPSKRRYLGVKDSDGGILVLSTLTGSGAIDVIKADDVIIEWDGHKIDNLGFYKDPVLGRISISNLIKHSREPGETAELKIIRNKKTETLKLKLSNRSDRDNLIPENITGEKPEYLIEGGFIIREVTGKFLRAHGGNWYKMVDPRIVNSYHTQRTSPENPGDRLIVVSSVLPDPINIGYQHFYTSVVDKLNGKPVKNMTDVFKIADSDGSISRISMRSMSIDLVMDKKELPKANKRIARKYRISQMRYRAKAD